ncbi:hypothetical protein Tco_0050982 [Tanacetum coccineum]
MGIGTTEEEVNSAAKIIGCSTFSSPFKYLGVKVGSSSSRNSFWDEVISKILSRLSKWKAKSLSIGGRFTLIKSVLTSLPLYFMSIYKAPMGVLHKLESIRRKFFNGVDNNWVWRFRSDQISLWSRLIRAIHGDDIINTGCFSRSSPWIHITREVRSLYLKGINLLAHVKKKVGNESTTLFWKDPWFAESPLIKVFPRLFALESNKNATVAEKFHDISLLHSFRRRPRGGAEEEQYCSLVDKLNSVVLSNSTDRWVWSIDSSGEFSVKSTRALIDDLILPAASNEVKFVSSWD